MLGLDDTDREIIRLLLADGRRPYSDIAEQVDLSAPAVSDRVDRLHEMGVLRGFTVDLDRSVLRAGVPVLIDIVARPGQTSTIAEALGSAEAVEHCFQTADSRVLVTATLEQGAVQSFLESTVDLAIVERYEVRLLTETDWGPSVAGAEFAPECAECGNTVDSEGESRDLDGTTRYFCCGSCAERFVEQYESLKEGT